MEFNAPEVGLRIKSLREKFRYSQEQLADLTSISRQGVAAIETGRSNNPGVIGIIGICKALNVSIEELLFGQPAATYTLTNTQTNSGDVRELAGSYGAITQSVGGGGEELAKCREELARVMGERDAFKQIAMNK